MDIYIEGRLTRVITVGGFKISANLIEDIIQEDDCVKECVVVAIPDAEKGEIPMAFIVLKSGTQIQESDIVQEIKKRCHMHLKEKAVPKYYYVLDSIPYTSNNKQDYKKLEKIGEKYIYSQSNIKI